MCLGSLYDDVDCCGDDVAADDNDYDGARRYDDDDAQDSEEHQIRIEATNTKNIRNTCFEYVNVACTK